MINCMSGSMEDTLEVAGWTLRGVHQGRGWTPIGVRQEAGRQEQALPFPASAAAKRSSCLYSCPRTTRP